MDIRKKSSQESLEIYNDVAEDDVIVIVIDQFKKKTLFEGFSNILVKYYFY